MNSVIKGASYVLVHTPDMVLYNGTTQTTERVVNPDSEYLKAVPEHLRSYEEAVSYWPNQTYIGNAHPDELAEIEFRIMTRKRRGRTLRKIWRDHAGRRILASGTGM